MTEEGGDTGSSTRGTDLKLLLRSRVAIVDLKEEDMFLSFLEVGMGFEVIDGIKGRKEKHGHHFI